MFRIIDKHNANMNQCALESIYRYRHWYFVDRMKWEDIRKDDGREIDQYDDDNAVHIAKFNEGRVVSYTRLIPSNKPHLLSEVYPEIMDGNEYETGEGIFEWTRFSVDPNFGNLARLNDETKLIFHAIAEYCLHSKIKHLIVETHPLYMSWLSEMEWDVTPISTIKRIDGKKVVAFTAKPTLATIEKGKEMNYLDDSIIENLNASERSKPEVKLYSVS